MTTEDEWTAADGPSLEKSPPRTPEPATEPLRPAVTKSAPRKSAGTKRNRKRWIGAGIVAALVVALVGLGAGELYLRHEVKACMAKAFGSLTGEKTDVSLSAKPMLLQALTKKIPFVEVNSSGSGDGRLHLRVDDIAAAGNQSTISKVDGDGIMPFTQLLATARAGNGFGAGQSDDPSADPLGQLAGNAQLESIRSNGDGSFDVTATVQAVIIPLPVTVTLKPDVANGKPHLTVVKANMLAFGIPPNFAQTVVDNLTQAISGPMLKGMTLTKFEVQGEGLAFALHGQNVTVDENLARPRSNCGDFTVAA
ncbi:DUF2993 domain-containing protein [Gordonia sp. X0973]|uniref:LmeA family phospholipid-binding protein n=1 Tax=Gordonia sp. X0973 TaxID=2742602 RepID=UPI0013EB8D4F|nr:DUF2993 domain-containing protein [Gordonia sp. X0973]QKT06195.1 DUF2993 domain-containing protein [Gordonia sp. X0973]